MEEKDERVVSHHLFPRFFNMKVNKGLKGNFDMLEALFEENKENIAQVESI